MTDRQFCAVFVLLVSGLVAEITKSENLSENAAAEELYNSELYSALENESTKLWHLSPKALYELYAQEKRTGKIIYPEEA